MKMLWFYLSVFVLSSVAVACPTIELATFDKDEVSVNLDLEKLAAKLAEIYKQPKCNCVVEIVCTKLKKKYLSVKNKTKVILILTFCILIKLKKSMTLLKLV